MSWMSLLFATELLILLRLDESCLKQVGQGWGGVGHSGRGLSDWLPAHLLSRRNLRFPLTAAAVTSETLHWRENKIMSWTRTIVLTRALPTSRPESGPGSWRLNAAMGFFCCTGWWMTKINLIEKILRTLEFFPLTPAGYCARWVALL